MTGYPHSPNLHHSGWISGNHWAVAHRCSRCGAIEYQLYDPDGPHSGNLQEQRPPDGWAEGFDMLLCPSCSKSFSEWLKGVKED